MRLGRDSSFPALTDFQCTHTSTDSTWQHTPGRLIMADLLFYDRDGRSDDSADLPKFPGERPQQHQATSWKEIVGFFLLLSLAPASVIPDANFAYLSSFFLSVMIMLRDWQNYILGKALSNWWLPLVKSRKAFSLILTSTELIGANLIHMLKAVYNCYQIITIME